MGIFNKEDDTGYYPEIKKERTIDLYYSDGHGNEINISEMERENERLKEQILKMRNNDNCLHGGRDFEGNCECDLKISVLKCPCEKWQL